MLPEISPPAPVLGQRQQAFHIPQLNVPRTADGQPLSIGTESDGGSVGVEGDFAMACLCIPDFGAAMYTGYS